MTTASKTIAGVSVAAAVGVAVLLDQPSPVVPMFPISWNCNYDDPSNEVTQIFSSTNLSSPLSQWREKWHGPTNRICFPETNAAEFFIVRNSNTLTGAVSGWCTN
jgi:hypothetical protein